MYAADIRMRAIVVGAIAILAIAAVVCIALVVMTQGSLAEAHSSAPISETIHDPGAVEEAS